MNELIAILPMLLPKAIAWGQAQEKLIIEHGVPLGGKGVNDARTVGVKNPEKIRVAIVSSLPLPDDDELRTIALNAGLLGPNMIGLTLGYGIFIVRGHETRQLFTHEFRHVYQFEQAGSIASFLPEYLEQVFHRGYWDAPLETDAREHEIT